MIGINRETYLDKLHACWLGKNIGGTLGAPYEGTREFLDVKGFATPSGEPTPNDDLDLQIVWLLALEETGVRRFHANVLGEYWLDWIPPHWNEYGTAKTNLRLGLLPPMSGEVDNERWKHSNGAWIRSEIWAGLAPCVPDVAAKYAVMDASVDHGLGEGTYAEIFTASLQSAAYAESDLRVLIETALSKLPEDCMVAKTVRLVMKCYDEGLPYRETREKVVEFNAELGWFQAPNNLGFVTIGLLYGEGDFKKSVLYAVNCGDDTDCTAATVGATLGIVGGTAAIPDEWKNFVGERIVTVAVSGMYAPRLPKTCAELTERIAALLPEIMRENGVPFAFTDGVAAPKADFSRYNVKKASDFLSRSPYSYDVTHYNSFTVRVELDRTPRVSQGDERKITLTFLGNPLVGETRKLQMKLFLPETWSVSDYPRTVQHLYNQPIHELYGVSSASFTVTVGEKIEAVNRVYAEITSPTLSYPIVVPITLIG